MNVRQLIEKLSTVNPEATVIVYSQMDEGMDSDVSGVATRAELSVDDPGAEEYGGEPGEGRFPYCKGYSFQEYNEDNDNDYVVIGASAQ